VVFVHDFLSHTLALSVCPEGAGREGGRQQGAGRQGAETKREGQERERVREQERGKGTP